MSHSAQLTELKWSLYLKQLTVLTQFTSIKKRKIKSVILIYELRFLLFKKLHELLGTETKIEIALDFIN